VTGFLPGDNVLCHPLPLRDRGTWAPLLIAAAESLAVKPSSVPWDVADAFPVPALTAYQVRPQRWCRVRVVAVGCKWHRRQLAGGPAVRSAQ
jgi:NADPH:quinone reductase-like Zn-dependent oxidoreductase